MGLGLVQLGAGTASGVPNSSTGIDVRGVKKTQCFSQHSVAKKAWASDEEKAFINQDSSVRWCLL